MKLIDRIEIRYFRSLYSIDLKGINHLNIISGSNDTGKSNILKALNLFFDGFTDWDERVDFNRDINNRRLEEVKSESIKGKQIIWIAVTFDTPDSYNGSLPDNVRVKKKWDRYNNERLETNLDTKEKHGDLPSTIKVANRFLSRFLNKIEFEYIPAVRDSSFRSHVLNRLQNYILKSQGDNDKITDTVEDLAKHIDPKIKELKEDFERITNIESSISPPDDVTSLFQSFNVSTEAAGESNVLLENRGDGIQSQYLLSALRHICSSSNNYNIWAFEEPENSLEYSRVKSLGNDLLNDCSESQIFATTHSPALINLDSDKCDIFRVHTNEKTDSDVYRISEHPEANKLSKDIGIEHIKSDIYEDYKNKIQKIERLKESIEELSELDKNKILTEGNTDSKIIRTAFHKLNGEDPDFRIEPADPGSGGGASMLSKFIETTKPQDNYTTIAVFDRDNQGIDKFENLSENFEYLNGEDDIKVHKNGSAYATLLPIPEFRDKDDDICIEKMFENEVLRKKNSEGKGLEVKEGSIKGVALENGDFRELDKESSEYEEIRKILGDTGCDNISIVSGKKIFAEDIVPCLERGKFSSFQKLFNKIQNILEE